MRETIAVLGANSFSGAAFVKHAAHAGYSVVPMRRPQYDVNTELDAIRRVIDDTRPEYFVNFAALNVVAESWQHHADYYRTNVIGIARLAEALRGRNFLRKFVQVSTPEVYGTTERFLKEDAAFRPSTPYAVSRAAADMHLAAMHATYGLPVCFTRSVNVYGPGQQPYRVIPKTALSIAKGKKLPLHGGGQSTRSFIHISDVAAAVLAVAVDGRPGHTYHVATERQTSIFRLVQMVAERMGKDVSEVVEPAPERPGKDMAYQLDDSKIRGELRWTDTIGLETGLDETVTWFRERAGSFDSLQYEHRP